MLMGTSTTAGAVTSPPVAAAPLCAHAGPSQVPTAVLALSLALSPPSASTKRRLRENMGGRCDLDADRGGAVGCATRELASMLSTCAHTSSTMLSSQLAIVDDGTAVARGEVITWSTSSP